MSMTNDAEPITTTESFSLPVEDVRAVEARLGGTESKSEFYRRAVQQALEQTNE